MIIEASFEFDLKYVPFIHEIIVELGFPIVYENKPIETINQIRALNHKWNLELGKISIRLPKEEKLIALKKYIEECEVGWYKKHAEERLIEIIETNGI